MPDLDGLRARLARLTVAGDDTAGHAPAAVLVAITMGAVPGVLLTKRTGHLTRHPGQVSFPGGRIDAADASPEAAALREAQEEVGLDPGAVALLGRLPDQVTGTGFRITPVLGTIPPGLVFRPSAAEVEAVFELPLATLRDPAAPWRELVEVEGRSRQFWVWPHPQYRIWGATAAILVRLADLLKPDP